MNGPRPITVTIAALGGQGGGVVSDWIIDVARRSGYLAQATSVPGVAQRTGATIYYLELFPLAALPPDRRRPIFALMPNPGDVDVVIASEIMEAGRAMQRGLVTDRTTLIASSHRIYAIQEKSHMADGRVDSRRVRELALEHAKRYIEFDMQAMADANGSMISAAMLGALCGSGALPFAAEHYVAAIRASGVEAASSTRTFEAARCEAERCAGAVSPAAVSTAAASAPAEAHPEPSQVRAALPAALEERIRTCVPASAQDTAREGVRRMIDYQDLAYARLYLDRLDAVIALEPATPAKFALSESVARGLALWMSFEDTIRVADLKIRSARTKRVLREVHPSPGQLVQVTEFMKPRVEEICGTLSAGLGAWILRSPRPRRWVARLAGGRQIATSSIVGFLQLYWLAGLRSWRRKTLRYAEEQARIERWLGLIGRVAGQNYALAVEIAECQQLIKGYGETHERGAARFDAILARVPVWQHREDAPDRIRTLRIAALADEEGTALSWALAAVA
ncbi:MAG TPA: indolepyruvate oxidoreductase subunit beta family protein [Steroidobacteraceae bacterium]|nr:indolepyruvate oxidoreductase subunit beta family protein [Steroidobacteraceae bacterium]